MMMLGFRGTRITDSDSIWADIVDRHLGGVVLFDYDVPSRTPVRNVSSPAQLKSLTATLQNAAGGDLLIAIDQEGGRVNRLKERLGFPATVSAKRLGSIDNQDTTRAYASRTAGVLRELGINMNFAPVVDLDLNPDNPVIGGIERSFGSTSEIVTRHARLFVEAHRGMGVATVLKHFPGHGSSAGDTHLGVTDVTDTWRQTELEPYRELISEGLCRVVMTAHVVHRGLDAGGLPGTLSRAVVTDVLRDSLGFDGVIVSDDLQMGAVREYYGLEETIRLALDAGVDILTFANNSVYEPDIGARAMDVILNLVDDGQVTRARLEESYMRILELKNELGLGEE
jgi:beta-N-acetylhexosaminidase